MTKSDLCTAVEIWYVNLLEFGFDYIGHDRTNRICMVLGMLFNHKEKGLLLPAQFVGELNSEYLI